MFRFDGVTYKNLLSIPCLDIPANGIFTLFGPSGGGKTTLLRLLNKMISPTEGHIYFHGNPLADLDSVAHRRRVTMLSQNPTVFEGTIGYNLNIGRLFQGLTPATESELREILETVRLNKPPDHASGVLSGGEKQRLCLGRILLLDPEVYLLDEPSASLDEETEELMIGMLVDHVKQRGKTMIMVTHSWKMASMYSDSVLEISNGSCRKGDRI